jgi:hypothetical protein
VIKCQERFFNLILSFSKHFFIEPFLHGWVLLPLVLTVGGKAIITANSNLIFGVLSKILEVNALF